MLASSPSLAPVVDRCAGVGRGAGRRALRRVWLALIVTVLAACAAPLAPPPEPPRAELLELIPYPSPFGEHVLVLGLPGCAQARLGVVGLSLEEAEPSSEGRVAEDGSFLLEIPGREGDVLRIQTVEGRRSRPIDVVAGFGTPALAPAGVACLEVPSTLELSGGRGTLAIDNGCEVPAEVTRLALRAPAALRVGGAPFSGAPFDVAPFTVAPGARVELPVEATEPGPIDALLFVEVQALDPEARAVSIVAP